MYVVPRVITWS